MEQPCLHCQAALCNGSWSGDWDYCCWVTRVHTTTPQTDPLLTGAATAGTSLLSPSGLMSLARNPFLNAPGFYNGNQMKRVGNSQEIHCRRAVLGVSSNASTDPPRKHNPNHKIDLITASLESQSMRFSTVWAVSDNWLQESIRSMSQQDK